MLSRTTHLAPLLQASMSKKSREDQWLKGALAPLARFVPVLSRPTSWKKEKKQDSKVFIHGK